MGSREGGALRWLRRLRGCRDEAIGAVGSRTAPQVLAPNATRTSAARGDVSRTAAVMHGQSWASKRFYNAFFRWHTITTGPIYYRPLSTSSRRAAAEQGREDGKRGTSIRRHFVKGSAFDRSPVVKQVHLKKHDAKLLNARVHTASERPFDTAQAWDAIVRYRSETGVLLQIAVPHGIVERFQSKHGSQLGKLQEKYGAHIELGGTIRSNGRLLTSITLSGTVQEVGLSQNHIMGERESRWLRRRPVSQQERPPGSLPPGGKVVRELDEEYRKVEIALPLGDWTHLQNTVTVDVFAAHHGVKMECIDTATFDYDRPESNNAAQAVLVSGTILAVDSAIRALFGRGSGRRAIAEVEKSGEDIRVSNKQHHHHADSRTVGRDVLPAEKGDMSTDQQHTSGTGQRYYIRLAASKTPQGRPSVWSVISGANDLRLERIQEHYDVSIGLRNNGKFIKIVGAAKGQVKGAKNALQNLMDAVCRQHDMSVGQMEEVEAGPVRADAVRQHAKTLDQVESDDFKLSLRALSHSVVLITSRLDVPAGFQRPTDALPFCRGVTVSSFNSVTVAPRPIISFNIRVPSRSWDAITSSGRMVVHVLEATPVGAALAHAFTLPYERPDEPFWRIQRMGASVFIDTRTSNARPLTRRIEGPEVRLEGAVAVTFDANMLRDKCVQVDDHMIVVAEVSSVRFPKAKNTDEARRRIETETALIYSKRGYHHVGEEIPREEMTGAESQESARSVMVVANQAAQIHSAPKEAQASSNAQDHIGAPVVETLESAAPEVANTRTPERTDIDYFEAIDDEEFRSTPNSASTPVPPRKEVAQEDDEYDFGFASVEDDLTGGMGSRGQPLVEDSAAAQDGLALDLGSADLVIDKADHAGEEDKSADTNKRHAAEPGAM